MRFHDSFPYLKSKSDVAHVTSEPTCALRCFNRLNWWLRLRWWYWLGWCYHRRYNRWSYNRIGYSNWFSNWFSNWLSNWFPNWFALLNRQYWWNHFDRWRRWRWRRRMLRDWNMTDRYWGRYLHWGYDIGSAWRRIGKRWTRRCSMNLKMGLFYRKIKKKKRY